MTQHDEITEVAAQLEALGNESRLNIFHLLVSAGDTGLPVGDILNTLSIAPSTLTHHIQRLTAVGLVSQTRVGRKLMCRANFATMYQVISFLTRNCCSMEADLQSEEAAA